MNSDVKMRIMQADGANNCALLEAYLKLFNDAENLPFLSYTGIPFSRELVAGWLADAAQCGIEYYTAVNEDGDIKGIMVTRHHNAENYELFSLVVDRNERHAGLGSALIETAIHKARDNGFKAVDIAVFADNARMLSLVIRHGFKPVRIEARKRFDGEDVVYLRKYGI